MWSADENKPGINYIDVENHTLNDIERISQLINQKKKENNIDIIILSIHWGKL